VGLKNPKVGAPGTCLPAVAGLPAGRQVEPFVHTI